MNGSTEFRPLSYAIAGRGCSRFDAPGALAYAFALREGVCATQSKCRRLSAMEAWA